MSLVERIGGQGLEGTEGFVGTILVVDDDPTLLRAVGQMVRAMAREVCLAPDAESAEPVLIGGIDLLITDIRLGIGASGIALAEAAAGLTPAPPVVAMTGHADPSECFALGRAGVGVLLEKPFGRDQLFAAIAEVRSSPSTFVSVVSRAVGRYRMPDMLHAVRRTMVLEALARTGGNRARAATLLGISRQNLQKILQRGKIDNG